MQKRSQRLKKKNIDAPSQKIIAKIPIKAILYVIAMLAIIAVLIYKFYRAPRSQEIAQLAQHLKTWHMVPELAVIFRIFCFLIIVVSILSFYISKNSSIRVVFGLDTLPRKVTFKDWDPFNAFTVWCWALEGLCMAMLIILELGWGSSPWFVEATQLVFELSLAFAMLVTTIVTFVIIPGGIKANHNMDVMFSVRALLMHNANLLFMIVELLLCQIRFNPTHVIFAPLFGLAYISFSWFIAKRRGYFLYWFINYNYKYILLSYSLLTIVLITFFEIATGISHLVDPIQNPWSVPLAILGGLSVCRFRR